RLWRVTRRPTPPRRRCVSRAYDTLSCRPQLSERRAALPLHEPWRETMAVADASYFDHDQQADDRRATDTSLQSERRAADELLADEGAARADAGSPERIAGQLADIGDGMADVTSTLADERHDVDRRLQRERGVTDRIIGQELEEVKAAIADDVRAGREQLHEERHVTDHKLAEERQHTDQAVDHVVDLIGEETAQHAAAERRAATRSEILRIVSHDLRGPLMAIGGAAALIQAHAPAGESGQRIVDWTLTI